MVICTRNRAAWLAQTLGTYSALETDGPWEMVLVDNGSSDATPSILRDFAAAARFPCRVVSEPVAGLSRARNTGWRAARGDIVAFTDDDCYPEKDFLRRIAECFGENGPDYLGGRILLFDPADYPITIQTDEGTHAIAPGSFVQAGLIQGANMSARMRVLQALDGFDEDLGAGTAFPCEDVEFLSRASAHGFTGAYDPRPVVYHHHRRRTRAQVSALKRSYDIGRGAYLMKCLLDSRRRKLALKNWYWANRKRLRRLTVEPREAKAALLEIWGALHYLLVVAAARASTGRRAA